VIKLAEADDRIVAITAAMPGPTGLLPFQERFPDRFFDVGIAEQHAVTAAAGMAMGGMRPIVAIYSTFLNRAWDQVVYDVALHRLPVIFCIDRAGITGPDGPSHHGVFDLAMLARVPGMRVLAPSSAQELQVMMADAAVLVADGPVAIRYPRGRARQVGEHDVGSGLHGRCVRRAGSPAASACVVAIGKLVATAERAADELAGSGIDITVWDARCCAPLDPDLLADAAAHRAVITVEDGIADGGIGSAIARQVAELSPDVVTRTLGLPTRFIPHAGTPDDILTALGLDHDGIATAVRTTLSTFV
jgi:1-deoxy-D-xylulose-5-phosphate synthase